MSSTVTQLTGRGSDRELPHLPPIARDVTDDAREVIDQLKTAGGEANIAAAEMARLLEQLAAMAVRPRRRELPAWKRLPVEQARMFIDQLATLPRDSETGCARLLGRLEVHAARLLDVIDSEVAPW